MDDKERINTLEAENKQLKEMVRLACEEGGTLSRLAREKAALEAELKECRGEPFAADPSKWPHKDQIEGLRQQLGDVKVKP